MRRREFITLLGGAATAWPLAARAQQRNMPVVGYLYSGSLNSPSVDSEYVPAFRKGLSEAGFVEGQNVTLEYRWAEGEFERLPTLAADLIHRQVNVIAAPGEPAALAAKKATSTLPIVFTTGTDPVQNGLVTSLNRPGGNATGVSQLTEVLIAKQIQLLHEVVPTAGTIGIFLNPGFASAESRVVAARAAASVLGLQVHVLHAGDEGELEAAFVTVAERKLGALLVIGDIGFLTSQNARIVDFAARHVVPTMHGRRNEVVIGGLMSYDTPLSDAYRIAGTYVGRILKGEKPENLPVQQSTRVELTINLKTARALGLTMPTALLVRADEVIE
jgi:putative tryptophan/tyrosine transport system substrate-binding protein